MRLMEMVSMVQVEIKGQLTVPANIHPSMAAADISHGEILVNGQQLSNVDITITGVNKTQQGTIFVVMVSGKVNGNGVRDIEVLKHSKVQVADYPLQVQAFNVQPMHQNNVHQLRQLVQASASTVT